MDLRSADQFRTVRERCSVDNKGMGQVERVLRGIKIAFDFQAVYPPRE